MVQVTEDMWIKEAVKEGEFTNEADARKWAKSHPDVVKQILHQLNDIYKKDRTARLHHN